MADLQVIDSGQGEYLPPDADAFRRFVRDNKPRAQVDKRMSAAEAIRRFVEDGNYVAYDGNLGYKGPCALLREIIRQRKRDLWVGAGPGGLEIPLLVAAGCVSRVDVGWINPGPTVQQAMNEGRLKLVEWTNGGLSYRHLAGAMGVPFLPIRFIGGTDVFRYSGAKLVRDPFTRQNIVLVPALYADVALIHVHQADRFGNARIFGPGFAPWERAASAKRVIISTEEIIDPQEIRRRPYLTTIPYYMVDAVVHAPLGAYPGAMPGLYRVEREHTADLVEADRSGTMEEFLEKWVYSVANEEEMMEKARQQVPREVGVRISPITDMMLASSVQEAFGI